MTATNLFITTGCHGGLITFSGHLQAAYRPRDVTKQRELLIPNNDKALLAHLIQGSGEQPE
jgi:hypothetical protein